MKRLCIFVAMLMPLVLAAQARQLTKAESKMKMEALSKLDQRYGISNYLDSYDMAIVLDRNEHYGVVTLDGSVVIPFEYECISYESSVDMFIILDTNGFIGCADRKGRIVIEPQYLNEYYLMEINYFTQGLMCCLDTNNKYGIVDTAGRVVVPFIYEGNLSVADYEKEMMYLHNYPEDEDYLLRFNGDTVVGPYSSLSVHPNGLVDVKINDKYGYIDITGRVVIPCEYDNYFYFEYGMATVVKDGKVGIIDSTGCELVPIAEDRYGGGYVDILTPRLISHCMGGNCGVLDLAGNIIIPHEYDYCHSILDDKIVMKDYNGRLYIFDTAGRLLETYDTDPEYEEFGITYGGKVVIKDGLWGFVNDNWEVVIPLRYKVLEQLDIACFRTVLEDGRSALLDSTGSVIATGPYERIMSFCDGIYSVTSYDNTDADQEATPNLHGFIDIYGNTTFSKRELRRMNKWMKTNINNNSK